LSALLRSILDGENHYIFDDSRIPSEMLLALMAAQNEIEQHFAQAA